MLSASRWTLPPSSPVVLVSKPLLTAYTPRRHRLPPLLNATRMPRACAPTALPRASDLSAIKSFYVLGVKSRGGHGHELEECGIDEGGPVW